MRIIFMGTPAFSVPTLQALVDAGHDVIACYSQPPRPAGRRGLELRKSPVHERAEQLGIEIRTPKSLKSETEQRSFADLAADVAVVVAYGLLLPKPILDAPRLGCYNGHASLLPRWRGAAPIQRAIMAGDTQTGMMIMKMDEGLDTGDIAMAQSVPIGPDTTTGEIHDTLALVGAGLMVQALAALERGSLSLTPQIETGVLYASKIEKAESKIDFSKNAEQIHNTIRGLSPFPGAWCEMQIGEKWERVKLLGSQFLSEAKLSPGIVEQGSELVIGCADGAVKITRMQKAGSKAMSAEEFLRGAPVLAVR